MPFCTLYSRTLFSEEFIYESKSYKTCARCMTKVKGKPVEKDKLDDEKAIIEIIFVQDISNYIANTIDNLENYSKLSLAFGICFDKVTLNTVDTNVKAIATLIIDEIESRDEYHWTATTAPNLSAHYYGVENAYYISIKIDIPLAEAKVFLKHEILHEKPIDIAIPSEVKQEIEKKLNLSPTDLCIHLYSRNFDLSKITYKQIHYCMTAIGFTTSLLLASHYTEIHCDATYRTAKGRFKLYGIVGNVEGTALDKVKPESIRLIYQNFKRQTNYPFLIWNSSKLQIVSKNNEDYTINNPINNIVEPYDTNKSYEHIATTCQRLEPKVVALQYLVDHVNEKFFANNLQHVEAIINNLNHTFTILSDIEKEKNKKLRGMT
ncbi:hypothetical protein F8M41_000313 [Gigaspora margarita]|uniref:Uncharacterized protein n=1 Tax=Gigaspora margarita TaxID=4874 RepID=A0A8H3XG70_GIGMA|nr:hypothetical protein F8M41_000313 [Gigaspora margarita]